MSILTKKRSQRIIEDISENPCFIHLKGRFNQKGTEAKYYDLGPESKFGVKVYDDYEIAKKAYNRQRLAAAYNIGPEVGRFLCVKVSKKIKFGYETEKANPVTTKCRVWIEQNEDLEKDLKKLNLHGDFRVWNCGELRGKLVSVDFGSHSRKNYYSRSPVLLAV